MMLKRLCIAQIKESKTTFSQVPTSFYFIDHTTSTPSLAAQIYESLKEKDVHSVDAPVTGGDIGARNGNLMTMVGSDKEVFQKVKPLLDSYSSKVEHMGAAGTG